MKKRIYVFAFVVVLTIFVIFLYQQYIIMTTIDITITEEVKNFERNGARA